MRSKQSAAPCEGRTLSSRVPGRTGTRSLEMYRESIFFVRTKGFSRTIRVAALVHWRIDKIEKPMMNVLPWPRHIHSTDADAMLRQLKVEPHLLPVD